MPRRALDTRNSLSRSIKRRLLREAGDSCTTCTPFEDRVAFPSLQGVLTAVIVRCGESEVAGELSFMGKGRTFRKRLGRQLVVRIGSGYTCCRGGTDGRLHRHCCCAWTFHRGIRALCSGTLGWGEGRWWVHCCFRRGVSQRWHSIRRHAYISLLLLDAVCPWR